MRPQFRSTCSRALSLAEVLLVMALLLVVTGLMAGLVRHYSEILRFGGGKSHTLEVAQVALARMASEVTEAATLDISNPTVLDLERLDPDPAVRALRLPETGSIGVPAGWQPFATSQLVRVVYQRATGDRLVRSAGGQDLEIADGITFLGLSSSAGSVEIRISTLEGGRSLRTLSTHVFLPASFAP